MKRIFQDSVPAKSAEQCSDPSSPGQEEHYYLRASQLILFALLLFSYCYVHQDYRGGTSMSRLDLLHAIVVDKTFKIDRYHSNTSDKALFRDHYYSDKAPGTVLLALPGFFLAHLFTDQSADPAVTWRIGGWLRASWIATVMSVGLITATGGAFFFEWLCRYVSPKISLISSVGLFLGAAPFPFATMLFSHSEVVGLLSIALWAIDRCRDKSCSNRVYPTVAGVCSALALVCEFTSGIVCGAILFLAARKGVKALIAFSVGAIPLVLIVPAYSWVCFGSVFKIGYSYQATFPEMKEGLYGIRFPDLTIALKLLVSSERGLFFWSPFLLMCLCGYGTLWRRSRLMFCLASLIPLSQIICISGNTWDWRAGWTLGPRYLAPILPLLVLPTAIGIQRFPILGSTLAITSVGLTALGTIVDATPRYEISNPLLELHLPGLLKADFTHNIGEIIGLSGYWSMVPLAVFNMTCAVALLHCLKKLHIDGMPSVSRI